MSHRFYSSTPIAGDSITLEGAEAHHLIHVMRLGVGAEIVVFDGSGSEFLAKVESVSRQHVELGVLQRQQCDRELPVRITLGVALPKGDRQRWLVEKAVELGVAGIVPLITARSVAQPADRARKRLERTVIEASKQCGRNVLAKIHPARSWDDYVADTPTETLRFVAHPQGELTLVSAVQSLASAGAVCLAVGPEGGLTGEEVDRAVKAGWQTIDLGSRTMRIETAAIALLACVSLSLGGPR